jgi:hypothetical protein
MWVKSTSDKTVDEKMKICHEFLRLPAKKAKSRFEDIRLQPL